MRFDITDLRLFVSVIEAGSITHGASRVNLALGSASGRIKQMEETAGVALLVRERLGVKPTEAGHTLLRHARATLASMQRLTDDLGEFANGLRGTVRLLTNTNALTEFLPGPIARFLAQHRNVSVELEEMLSHEIVAALVEGVADIGIVAAREDIGGLQRFPFATDRLCAVVPASQPEFANARDVSFASLLDYDFVGYAAGAAIQTYLEAHARELHRRLRPRIHLRSFDAICRLVENGVGVSVVPESAARRCRRTISIKTLALRENWALREMRVCVADVDALPMYARQLLGHLVESGRAFARRR
ncbi:LysR substrate-binding domain-containing protein [Burkholderia pseudomallei]|uniref:LysR substrate-binding domain-containing protein n=1 Tax=Burkholderia pseudomallei TaxID=28450 RepID=UPI00050EBE90|nr:LysR substrate-binding domain-containing protein [Burkholderia pseudomallei]KGC54392.1 bacterial regulatory helix-turn-helix, lysR family protein [Burkholderia pseudomallei]